MLPRIVLHQSPTYWRSLVLELFSLVPSNYYYLFIQLEQVYVMLKTYILVRCRLAFRLRARCEKRIPVHCVVYILYIVWLLQLQNRVLISKRLVI
jgi:hypothetical protein